MVEEINWFIDDKKQNVNIFPLTPQNKMGEYFVTEKDKDYQ